MEATKFHLSTDSQGMLVNLPTLPPNTELEAIFLVVDNQNAGKRKPSPVIAGKGRTIGDIDKPFVDEKDWECLK
ncbi:MAG: hypothetical protein HON94_10075 [Methylococcales bacterium]|jgi:hypothetical protein|nr:hypothetical protein [Methylococcales bacterium]